MAPADSAPLTLYLVKRVELAVRARIEEIVRPAGLTTNQYTALTVLERHDDMSSAQLARLSFVTAQSMADVITSLEGRGLIERHRDRADRRRLRPDRGPVGDLGPGRGAGDRDRPAARRGQPRPTGLSQAGQPSTSGRRCSRLGIDRRTCAVKLVSTSATATPG